MNFILWWIAILPQNSGYERKIIQKEFIILAKVRLPTTVSIFDQNLDLWIKLLFLIKISIFDHCFDFRPPFRFLIKISLFDQNFDLMSKLGSWTNFFIFNQSYSKSIYVFKILIEQLLPPDRSTSINYLWNPKNRYTARQLRPIYWAKFSNVQFP